MPTRSGGAGGGARLMRSSSRRAPPPRRPSISAEQGGPPHIESGRRRAWLLRHPRGRPAFRIPLTLEAPPLVDHLRKTAQAEVSDQRRARPSRVYDVAAAHNLYQELVRHRPSRSSRRSTRSSLLNGPLLSLPFEMLVTDATPVISNGDYRKVPFLLKRFALSYVPAPQTFVLLRQIARRPRRPSPISASAISASRRARNSPRPSRPIAARPISTRWANSATAPHARRSSTSARAEVTAGHRARRQIQQGQPQRHRSEAYRVVHLATHAFLPTELRCLSQPSILMSAPVQADSAKDAFLAGDDAGTEARCRPRDRLRLQHRGSRRRRRREPVGPRALLLLRRLARPPRHALVGRGSIRRVPHHPRLPA